MTFTVMLVPAAGGFQVAGLIEKCGAPAACVTLKLSPAMLNVQLRPAQLGLALADTSTARLPVALIGVTVSQSVHGLSTDQLHALPAVTLTLTLPPPPSALQALTLMDGGCTIQAISFQIGWIGTAVFRHPPQGCSA